MKLYLSSFELGDHPDRLTELFDANKRIGYVPNACDYTHVDLEKKARRNETDMAALWAIGLQTEYLDLREYFGRPDELRARIGSLGGVFVRGGNTFILRQAMRLSGLDTILCDLRADADFVYSGYSAGVCVLGPTLHALRIVDNPTDLPYPQIREPIWEGL
jgi:dipeptidase E